jgi:hypothetical protein
VGSLLGYQSTSLRSVPYQVFFVADQIRGARVADYINLHGDSVMGQFTLPIIFKVCYCPIRNRKYVDLKTQIVGLEKNKGIIQVTLPQEEDADFIVRTAGMTSVYADLIPGLWPSKKCWLEGTRLWFYQLDPLQEEILVKAIPSLFYWVHDSPDGELYYDDEMPQPYDFNAFLIEGARAWFEEQKYYGDSRLNLGTEKNPSQPRQILQAGLPQGQGGIGATL